MAHRTLVRLFKTLLMEEMQTTTYVGYASTVSRPKMVPDLLKSSELSILRRLVRQSQSKCRLLLRQQSKIWMPKDPLSNQ
jgi:hypothetical protein